MNYSKINNLTGWACFAIALLTYILTLDPKASFWDCGEFIAAAFRLQVVHQPGAPLFLMIERFFSLFAGQAPERIAYWMNLGSALASAGTILFLCWTITALAKKILIRKAEAMSSGQLISIMGAGIVGALAYTFSDSFWFSAVETEVYALSSLFTAVVFWAILKWEAQADEPGADRWLLFIAYMMGLSIGIHLLNLLTIPALAFVYYFRKTGKPGLSGIIKTLFTGIFMLAFIQYGIVQYLISIAASFDLFFVNSLGLGFGSGILFFILMVAVALIFGIRYSVIHQKRILNLCLLSTVLIIFGYSSFAMVVIRASAGPSLNNNDASEVFSFLGYISREQYGDRPLLSGPSYNSQNPEYKEGKTIWRKGKDKYESAGKKGEYQYAETTLLPRMYSTKENHATFYKNWMKVDDDHRPGLIDNLNFLSTYQVGYMYVRYLMWNFVGRQNDIQGQGSGYEGEWLSGIKLIDSLRLGDQRHLPPSTIDNKAYNRFYFLPFLLGVIGLVWHISRSKKDAGIVALLFFFTGLAIVLYLNQTPMEPRERDYAYTGSFYTFCIWIGLSVVALSEWLFRKFNPVRAAVAATVLTLLAAPVLMAQQGWDDHNRSDKWMARDLAYNYLQSCAPNAILFTYADNDTFPLWYVQEVEGLRPDVRVVCLSLFDADWYINGMKKKQNESESLPMKMRQDQYVKGKRDMMPYVDYKLQGSIELKSVLELLLSDLDEDKVEMQDGEKLNFLPTKKLKITVNPGQVLESGTLAAAERNNITPALEWTYNQDYVTKGTLALFDILAHNDWKRPIYFSNGMPDAERVGLDKYLYNEGLISRLLPLKASPQANNNPERLRTEVLYDHVMNNFKWGNVKNANHLDEQSANDTVLFSSLFNTLTASLIERGDLNKAKKVIAKHEQVIPNRYYGGLRSMMLKYTMAQHLYQLGEVAKANDTLMKNAVYIDQELSYLADISASKKSLTGMKNVQTGLYFMNEMLETSKYYQQEQLSKLLETKLNHLHQRFAVYINE